MDEFRTYIKTLKDNELIKLGAIPNKRPKMISDLIKKYNDTESTSITDYKQKLKKVIPRFASMSPIESELKSDILQEFGPVKVKKHGYTYLKAEYEKLIAEYNFNEILRIAKLNNNVIKYKNNDIEIYYHINENNLETLRNLLNGEDDENTTGSDADLVKTITENIHDVYGADLENIRTTNRNEQGGFILFNHTTNLDFSRYGIFNKNQDVTYYHKNNCLYHAFKASKMSETKLEALKTKFFQRDISIKNLKDIAEYLKIKIILHRKLEGAANRTYGDSDEVYELAIQNSHFFVYERTKYTSFFLNNYEMLKDENNPRNIFGIKNNKYIRRNDKGIYSDVVMKILLEKYSTPIDKMDLLNTPYHSKIENKVTSLEYLDNNTKLLEPKKPKIREVLKVYFDFETVNSNIYDPKNKGHIVKPREVTYYIDKIYYHDGYDCGKKFIKHILSLENKEIHLIAHNATFDFNFIAKHLPNLSIVKSGKRLIKATSTFKNKLIVVKDSLNFIISPLSEFSKIFKVQTSKLFFDHDWVRQEDLNENGVMINVNRELNADFLEKAPADFKEQTKNFIKNNKINLKEYSKYYNIFDVLTLKEGFEKFSEWCKLLDINIDDVSTASSMAQQYALQEGCFEDCYQLSGAPQFFINQSVLGGRVMTESNEAFELTDTKVVTLDANSLYPSAMIKFPGFLKGKPKILEDTSMEFLNRQSYYFVEIEVTKVRKNYKMPLLYTRSNISIEYKNTTGTITVGKTQLEDLIKFHEIEYVIIRGYYFDEGFNTKINETIKYLYDTRNTLKANQNPAEQIYKLIMNSIYGKCLQKPRDKKLVIKNSKEDMLKYFKRNKNNVEMAESIYDCDKWIIREYKEINEDYNFVHIGSHILEESKRIMNEVITLAENNDIRVYYTDTDSMHLNMDDVSKLERLYKKQYKKDLMGDNLLQFKQDFGRDSKNNLRYATKCIFLGKKTYIDYMNDHKHIYKAKGITKNAIKYKAKQSDGNIDDNIYKIYKDRLEGKEQIFDLTCGGNEFTIKHTTNINIVKLNSFNRKF